MLNADERTSQGYEPEETGAPGESREPVNPGQEEAPLPPQEVKPLAKPENSFLIWALAITAAVATFFFARNFLLPAATLPLFYFYWMRRAYSGRNAFGIIIFVFLGAELVLKGYLAGFGSKDGLICLALSLVYLFFIGLLIYARVRDLRYRRYQIRLAAYKKAMGLEEEPAPAAPAAPAPPAEEAYEDYEEYEEYEAEEGEAAYEDGDGEAGEPAYTHCDHPYEGESSLLSEDLSHPYEGDSGPCRPGNRKGIRRRKSAAPAKAPEPSPLDGAAGEEPSRGPEDGAPDYQAFDKPYEGADAPLPEDAEHPY